jgi:hypothetical protein
LQKSLSFNDIKKPGLWSVLVRRSRTGIHALYADLIDHAYVQVAVDPVLAGKSCVGAQIFLGREHHFFRLAHFRQFALDNFDTASGAPRIPAAAVQYIDAVVFKAKDKLAARLAFEFLKSSSSFSFDNWHLFFLFVSYFYFSLLLIDRHKDHFGFRNLYDLAGRSESFGLDIDVYRDGSISHLHRLRIKTDKIADKYRLMKDHLFHSDRHKPVMPRVPDRFNPAGHVNVTQDDTAKYGPVRIRIPRHHRQPYRCISI